MCFRRTVQSGIVFEIRMITRTLVKVRLLFVMKFRVSFIKEYSSHFSKWDPVVTGFLASAHEDCFFPSLLLPPIRLNF